MPNYPQGLAWFPGINQILDAHFSFGHGISPSVCTITIAPQTSFLAQIGTLVFGYGGDTITWPNARIDNASFERNGSGAVWRLSILDRRWHWKWGFLAGSFNLRYEDFEANIKYNSEATPQNLARFCLDTMGEGGYDVSALPNETRPTVEWDGEVPAEALANLCDELGCRVVLGLDNRVRICLAGVGAYLPENGIIEGSIMVDPPEKPSRFGILCGRTRYQADFELEAVGQEWDGEIRLIEDLSYKPTDGWDGGDAECGFASIEEPDLQALAAACVYKWYRVKVPVEVPEFGTVNHLWQLAFEDGRCESVLVPGTDPGGGVVKKIAPPLIYGAYWARDPSMENRQPADETNIPPLNSDDTSYLYGLDWSFDAAHAIVKFSEPVYANDYQEGDDPFEINMKVPKLFLRAACNIRDEQYRAWQRWGRTRQTDAPGNTATRWIKHDEMVLSIFPAYRESLTDYILGSNMDKINTEADYYLREAEKEYQYMEPRTVRYAGLRYIELDGAIQQIEFDVGPQGATTRASRNCESKRYTIPYKERRRLEQGRRLHEGQRQLSPSARWRARNVERAGQ